MTSIGTVARGGPGDGADIGEQVTYTLKPVVAATRPGGVELRHRTDEVLVLRDPDGSVGDLIRLLAIDPGTPAELHRGLLARGRSSTLPEVHHALRDLANADLICRADAPTADAGGRHRSTLAYLAWFADAEHAAGDWHARLRASRVLLLGAGGVGCAVLQSLVGMGVGSIHLVDSDRVEPANLARQFCYRQQDVGELKAPRAAAWARAFDPAVRVTADVEHVTDADQIVAWGRGADLVVCAVDGPPGVQLVIDEACHRLQLPWVCGGLAGPSLVYWSVQPGVSPCRTCLQLHRDEVAADTPPGELLSAPPINRGIGPAVQLVGGYLASEALRYLTGCEPPVAAARYHFVQLLQGMRTTTSDWAFHPDCPWDGHDHRAA